MATEYTITYTYTGQSNTSGARSVAFSKFKKSGDTGRTIGQIKSIKYVHWHTSTKAATWSLRGRLVFANGSITSPAVSVAIDGDTTKFTNTFTTLPTPEQFATLKTVQTLDSQGKTTSGGYSATLYWRATSDYKMQIIVTFIGEPPVTYAPKIDAFGVVRCDASGNPSEEGQYIRASLKLSAANNTVPSGASCKIYYAADAQPVVGVSQSIDLTSKISSLMTGVTNDPNILTGVWGVGNTWFFTVVFTAGEEMASSGVMYVERGTTSMHISGEPGGGVCIGGFSTGTTASPKFESRVPARFYAGVDGLTNYSTEEVQIGTWIDGKPIYRKTVSGSVSTTAGTSKAATIGSIANVAAVVDMYGIVNRSGAWFPLAMYAADNNHHRASFTSGNVQFTSTHSATAYATVEYTKTTD